MSDNEVILFLEHYIVNKFGVPNSLVLDNASYFSLMKLTEFALEKGIKIKYSSKYYPQGNGVEESSNKNLIIILKKIILKNQRNWHNALSNSL